MGEQRVANLSNPKTLRGGSRGIKFWVGTSNGDEGGKSYGKSKQTVNAQPCGQQCYENQVGRPVLKNRFGVGFGFKGIIRVLVKRFWGYGFYYGAIYRNCQAVS